MLIGDTRRPGRPTFADGAMLSIEGERARIAKRDAAWTELRQAADAHQKYIENLTAREHSTHEAYQRRNELIHRLTGVQLDNPWTLESSGPDQEAERAGRLAEWESSLAELRDRYPDHAGELQPGTIAGDRERVVREAEERYQAAALAAGDALSTSSRLGAELAGRGVGMLRDPFQVVALIAGAGPGTAATATARIGQVMLTEAIVNAGVESVVQVAAQRWRAENGLDHGWQDALTQVGLAGLFGAGFGGIAQGATEAMRALGKTDPGLVDLARKVAAGEASPGDTARLAEALDIDLSDMERRVGAIAEEQAGLDVAAFGDMPEGVTPDDAGRLIGEALAHVEGDAPPPAGALSVPPRAADVNRVVDETVPLSGEPITVHGRPAEFVRFDPESLETDARAYQYKDGGDETGVTERLRDVKQWDPTASGKIFVHERQDGRFVADGHQRLGLARRIKQDGDASVKLDGFLFRESDGWTVEDVRALAAKKNMQEGSGSAMDAARILRDRPDILDDALPISGPMMKKATALARLEDDAWGLVVNGIAAEHHGAAVGRLVDDPDRQAAVLAEIARAAPETDRMTELYVREIMAAGFSRETQTDMFGSAAVTRSLMAERVKVLDEALKLLSRDKRLFASLADNADMIEAAGNVLDTAGNVDKARTAETVMAMIDRLARSKGAVSDLLTEAAERFAGGSAAAREARAFVNGVRAAIERDGLKSLLSDAPAPVLKPAARVEPATPEAGEMAELARIEAGGELTSESGAGDMTGQPTIWDLMPDGVDAEGKPRFTDLSREQDKAAALDDAADLVAACKD